MAYCNDCGTKLDDGSKFCHHCGGAVYNYESVATNPKKEEYILKKDIENAENKTDSKINNKKQFYKKWSFGIVIAVFFIIFSIIISNIIVSKNESKTFIWTSLGLNDVLPPPKSNVGDIISDTDAVLEINVYDTSEQEYKDYVSRCKSLGFTVEQNEKNTRYNAFNDEGYELTLKYKKSEKTLYIKLEFITNLDRIKKENKNVEEFEWTDMNLNGHLPVPKSNIGEIFLDSDDYLRVDIYNTSATEYEDYISECKSLGYTIEEKENTFIFTAFNEEGYKVNLLYNKENNIMGINLESPIEMQEIQWPNSLIGSLLPVPESNIGNIQWEADYGFVIYIGNTAKSDYDRYVNACMDKGFNVDYRKGDDYYHASNADGYRVDIDYKGNNVMWIRADEPKAEESIKSDETPEQQENSKITITMGKDELIGLEKTDAEQKLKDMGFDTFEYRSSVTEQKDNNNKIENIEIKGNDNETVEFSKNGIHETGTTIILTVYEYKEPEKKTPVFYSTNDYETAKKGNTGVFSYKSKETKSYDLYYVIDFDEGYVYYFSDRNGETFCDRLKIVSGDLNDKVTITYHSGGDEWSYKLHFKYEGYPETLIMRDQNGFDFEYETTDLDNALAIKNTKKITDY